MAILWLALMRFVGLFAASVINQALVVLGRYAFVLAGSGEAAMLRPSSTAVRGSPLVSMQW